MDSLTQITLGAGVGEVLLGRKAGNKALFWGAVAGTIPDLDGIAGLILPPVEYFVFHRSATHSILFIVLLAPLLGWLIHWIHRRDPSVSRWEWTRLAFWGLFTHPLLDCFTGYGTQLFWPFSDHRIEWNTIFVVDPFYTLPFLAGLTVLAFLNRGSSVRRRLAVAALAVSTAYLGLTVVHKQLVEHQFRESLAAQGLPSGRLMTSPTPFNNLLWRGLVPFQGGYMEGYWSRLDGDAPIRFRFIEGRHDLLGRARPSEELRQLLRASDGYFCLTESGGDLLYHDLRFGTLDGWAAVTVHEPAFIFSFKLPRLDGPSPPDTRIARASVGFHVDGPLLRAYFARVLGNG